MLNSQEFARRGQRSADRGQGSGHLRPQSFQGVAAENLLRHCVHGNAPRFFRGASAGSSQCRIHRSSRAAALSQFKKDRELHVSVVNEARYIQELIHAGMTADLYFEK